MARELDANQEKHLSEIGAIFYNMGINTIEKAILLREHLESCQGGKSCIETLLNNVD